MTKLSSSQATKKKQIWMSLLRRSGYGDGGDVEKKKKDMVGIERRAETTRRIG